MSFEYLCEVPIRVSGKNDAKILKKPPKTSLESFSAKKNENSLKKILKISAIRTFRATAAVQDSGPGSSPAGATEGRQGDEKRSGAQAAGGDVTWGAAQVARQPTAAGGAQQQKGMTSQMR